MDCGRSDASICICRSARLGRRNLSSPGVADEGTISLVSLFARYDIMTHRRCPPVTQAASFEPVLWAGLSGCHQHSRATEGSLFVRVVYCALVLWTRPAPAPTSYQPHPLPTSIAAPDRGSSETLPMTGARARVFVLPLVTVAGTAVERLGCILTLQRCLVHLAVLERSPLVLSEVASGHDTTLRKFGRE